MKFYIHLLILLLPLSLYSQTEKFSNITSTKERFGNYYYGKYFQNYLGQTAKLDLKNHEFDLTKKLFSSKINSKYELWGNISDFTNFQNKIFRIDSIMDFEKEKDENMKVFRLKDIETKDVYFYVYEVDDDPSHSILTEFDKKSFDRYNENLFDRKVDDFTGEVKISSPFTSFGQILKYINKGRISYYLYLFSESSKIYRGKGVYILFTDGSKWSRPQEPINVDYDDGFTNNVFIKLNLNDLKVFQNKIFKKVRLYINDIDVDELNGENFRSYSSIILKSK